MKEITIRDVLVHELDWPLKFLSPSREIARLDFGYSNGQRVAGFKPFCRWQRFRNRSAFLPIDRILPKGCQIRFAPRLSGNLEFIGLVEPTADQSFPFGEWFQTSSSMLIDERLYYHAHHKRGSWLCSNITLTFLLDVSIKTVAFD